MTTNASENESCERTETPGGEVYQDDVVEVGAVSETKGGVFGITHDQGMGLTWAR